MGLVDCRVKVSIKRKRSRRALKGVAKFPPTVPQMSFVHPIPPSVGMLAGRSLTPDAYTLMRSVRSHHFTKNRSKQL